MIGPVHAFLGYLFAYASFKKLGQDGFKDGILASVLGAAPDIDFFTPFPYGTPIGHHGLTHCPLLLMLISAPFLVRYRRAAAPYFFALISHIFGDFIDNTVPLLAPLSWNEFGLRLSMFPSSEPLALSIQFLVTLVFAYVIAKSPKDFPIFLPQKYDKPATLAIAILPLVGLVAYRFFPSEVVGFHSIWLALLSALSSLLLLFVLASNSNFFKKRILDRIG